MTTSLRTRARRAVHTNLFAVLTATLFAIGLTTPAGAATVTDVFGGKVACSTQQGVQFCPGSPTVRVETWDGVPLDANVTIPPSDQDGPFPLIVSIHGWGIGKDQNPSVDWAMQGYVVLSYSARGFHNSCGFAPTRTPDPTLSNPTACLDRGWIRLGDIRYEVRDTQYLAGVLADEGLIIADKVGATGSSYGGGQSMMLAALKNRVMLENGTLVPWTSPLGTPMEIAAAAPLIPWSDLTASLAPNGRTLDTRALNPYGPRAGVLKQSWVDALYSVGVGVGFYSAPGQDPNADLTGWRDRLNQGEPYDGEADVDHIIDQIKNFHSAYYVDDSIEPAPLFLYNAWTDDLFPAHESLRFYNKTVSLYPNAEISLQFADGFGHPRAGLTADRSNVDPRIDQLFARHLKGSGDPAIPAVETYTQACGGSVQTGPFTSSDWAGNHPDVVTFIGAGSQVFDSTGGNAANASQTDPLAGTGGACRQTTDVDDTNVATYRLPAAVNGGFTMLGSPTVTAVLDITGADPDFAQVVARLWDVAGDGTQALVAQTLYRPDVTLAPQTFQLHPNGWVFSDGHVAKLELLGQSSPYGRASNGSFTITVSDLQLDLPAAETSGGGGPQVCGDAPATGCKQTTASRKSKIQIKDGVRGRDKLTWRFTRGEATTAADFGDPLADNGFSMCVYDGSGALLMNNAAPASPFCSSQVCWKQTNKGLKYKSRELRPDGLAKVDLRPGVEGKTKIKVIGKSASIGVPDLPVQTTPVTVQFISDNGNCWEAVYSSVDRNDAGQFKAKSD